MILTAVGCSFGIACFKRKMLTGFLYLTLFCYNDALPWQEAPTYC